LWSSKLGSASNELAFWDCFAGKGTYDGGQPGSPLQVLEESQRCWNGRRKIKLTCVFIEKDRNNFKELRETLRELYPDLENDRWFAYNSDYVDILDSAMNGEIEELQTLVRKPSLFFLDPFGFKGLSLGTIQKMMSRRSCEVLITLMVESIKRHRKTSRVIDHFKRMFGVDDLTRLNEICSKPHPEAEIVEYYEERLRSRDGANIKHTLSFAFTPTRRNVILYYLVFGTNHRAGLDAMHRTMRAISNNPDSFSFRGKSDGFVSLDFFIDPSRDITEWILSLPMTITNFNAITFRAAKAKKPYSHPEMRSVIVKLIREGKLEFVPVDERAKERGVLGKRYFRFVR
jgi:three-Cys-motif partner protein